MRCEQALYRYVIHKLLIKIVKLCVEEFLWFSEEQYGDICRELDFHIRSNQFRKHAQRSVSLVHENRRATIL